MSTTDAEGPGTNDHAATGSTNSTDTTGSSGADGPLVVWRAVLLGSLVGLVVLVAASVAGALLDRNLANYDDSGWRSALFVIVLLGYASAGFVAGRRAPSGALSNGALAGVFAFALWVPIRVVIWAVRDEHVGLFTGASPVLRPGQVFGHLVIAAALGMLGGVIGARVVVKHVR